MCGTLPCQSSVARILTLQHCLTAAGLWRQPLGCHLLCCAALCCAVPCCAVQQMHCVACCAVLCCAFTVWHSVHAGHGGGREGSQVWQERQSQERQEGQEGKEREGRQGQGQEEEGPHGTLLFALSDHLHAPHITFCTAVSLPINHVPISAQGQWTLQADQKPLTHQSLVIGQHPPTGH